MPHKIKRAEHYTGLRPTSNSEQRSLRTLCVYVVMALAAAIGIRQLQQHWQQVRELTWSSATGTILDVRPDPSTYIGLGYHPRPAYRVQVLVSFPVGGSTQQRWITLRKHFESLDEIQLDGQQWKRASCIVHWNPADPSQINAEIS